ncbi:hypothetical protein C8R46DRAFT_1061433, partial [Mycena filopes]
FAGPTLTVTFSNHPMTDLSSTNILLAPSSSSTDGFPPEPPPSATEAEKIAHHRRVNTLIARANRRRMQEERGALEEQATALRAKVAELRTIRSDFGLPPAREVELPSVPRNFEEEMDLEMEQCFGPNWQPVLPPSPTDIEKKLYYSKLASRRFRLRQRKHHQMLKDEVRRLKAEVNDFHSSMSSLSW